MNRTYDQADDEQQVEQDQQIPIYHEDVEVLINMTNKLTKLRAALERIRDELIVHSHDRKEFGDKLHIPLEDWLRIAQEALSLKE
jgi:hypothetical protein